MPGARKGNNKRQTSDKNEVTVQTSATDEEEPPRKRRKSARKDSKSSEKELREFVEDVSPLVCCCACSLTIFLCFESFHHFCFVYRLQS